jgi:hypothetical protein
LIEAFALAQSRSHQQDLLSSVQGIHPSKPLLRLFVLTQVCVLVDLWNAVYYSKIPETDRSAGMLHFILCFSFLFFFFFRFSLVPCLSAQASIPTTCQPRRRWRWLHWCMRWTATLFSTWPRQSPNV